MREMGDRMPIGRTIRAGNRFGVRAALGWAVMATRGGIGRHPQPLCPEKQGTAVIEGKSRNASSGRRERAAPSARALALELLRRSVAGLGLDELPLRLL